MPPRRARTRLRHAAPLALSVLLAAATAAAAAAATPPPAAAASPSPAPPPATPCPVLLPFATPAPSLQRIVGGEEAAPQARAFMVGLYNPIGLFRCSAALLSPQWVLTAKHCKVAPGWFAVVSARTTFLFLPSDAIPVAAVYAAPSPDPAPPASSSTMLNTLNDVAVVRLSQRAPSTARFVAVPGARAAAPRAGAVARAVGYGLTQAEQPIEEWERQLRQVDVRVVSNATCTKSYAPTDFVVSSDSLCAGQGGCDSCQGDSGGPLVMYTKRRRPVAIAVVSAGKGCAEPNFPGIYARTGPLVDWMASVGAVFETADDVVLFATGTPLASPSPPGTSATAGPATTSPRPIVPTSVLPSASAQPSAIPSSSSEQPSAVPSSPSEQPSAVPSSPSEQPNAVPSSSSEQPSAVPSPSPDQPGPVPPTQSRVPPTVRPTSTPAPSGSRPARPGAVGTTGVAAADDVQGGDNGMIALYAVLGVLGAALVVTLGVWLGARGGG